MQFTHTSRPCEIIHVVKWLIQIDVFKSWAFKENRFGWYFSFFFFLFSFLFLTNDMTSCGYHAIT